MNVTIGVYCEGCGIITGLGDGTTCHRCGMLYCEECAKKFVNKNCEKCQEEAKKDADRQSKITNLSHGLGY